MTTSRGNAPERVNITFSLKSDILLLQLIIFKPSVSIFFVQTNAGIDGSLNHCQSYTVLVSKIKMFTLLTERLCSDTHEKTYIFALSTYRDHKGKK